MGKDGNDNVYWASTFSLSVCRRKPRWKIVATSLYPNFKAYGLPETSRQSRRRSGRHSHIHALIRGRPGFMHRSAVRRQI